MDSNNLIYSRQSGFRKGHSTETALIKIIDDLLFNLDKDKVSGMILVDYQKTFDMVDLNILLEKLVACGLENRELQWCQSYLSQRKQVVQIGNTASREMFIKNGVPLLPRTIQVTSCQLYRIANTDRLVMNPKLSFSS